MHGCIPMEALGTLEALGPEDPRRLHVEHCARCSAMLAAYREFVRANTPQTANTRDADIRLAAFIAERIEGGTPASGGPRRARGRWFELPSFRYAAIAAAAVAVVIAVTQWRGTQNETVLRGDARIVITLEAPRAVSDGAAIELAWTSLPDADAYQVILLRNDLSEIVRLPATSERRLILPRATMPDDATHWQVAALREGAVVAESVPESL